MSRLVRTALTFCVVMLCYWSYALLAVPWIEPVVARNDGVVERPDGTPLNRSATIDLANLFPPDAWQNSPSCKILETSQGTLLFQTNKLLEKGQIELRPVSLVFQEQDGDGKKQWDKIIILDAPGGADLKTEGGLSLIPFKIGKIIGGRLNGDITIRSPANVDPSRALYLTTSNVRIDRQKIWTPSPVKFQYGKSQGSGRDLVIQLDKKEDEAESKEEGEDSILGGIKSIELVKVDGLQLPLKSSSGLPIAGGGDKSKQPATDEPTMLQVTCRGSFRFDVKNQLATFRDQVQVLRLNPTGPNDVLRCQKLSLRFAETTPAAQPRGGNESLDSEEDPPPPKAKLELRELIAEGAPVTIDAPSTPASARCDSLRYDLLTRRIVLEHHEKVTIKYQEYDIFARRLEYELHEEPERLGRLWAQGPGRIVGLVGKKEKKQSPFEARWSRLLQLEPQQANHVFSFYDNAQIQVGDVEQTGGFRADRIHFYVNEVPRSDPPQPPAASQRPPETERESRKFDIVPDRLNAVGNVVFDSPKLSGASREIYTWFKRVNGRLEDATIDSGGERPLALGSAAGASSRPNATPKPEEADRKFDVSGDVIQMQVLTDDKMEMKLDDVTIEGNVIVEQVRLGVKDQGPLRLSGHTLQISDVSRTTNRVQVHGAPAKISMGETSIQGARIYLDQPANRVWINGAGQMTFPSSKLEKGAGAPSTTIGWVGGMNFNGGTAIFDKQIEAQGTRRTKKGELLQYNAMAGRLEVTLDRPVNLQEPSKKKEDQPKLGLLRFAGGVYFENRTWNLAGKLATIDKMRTKDLSLNQISGEIYSGSPGWMSTVRHAKQRFVKPKGATEDQSVEKSDPRVTFLQVSFQQGLAGNSITKQIRCVGDVRAIYGPVEDFQQELTLSRPRANDTLLRCDDELIVNDVGVEKKRMVELIAIGNTVVEQQSFQAQRHRISYTESKDLVVMESNGHYNARLIMYGKEPGKDKELIARRIQFWPGTSDIKVDAAQSINLGAFGQRPSGASTGPVFDARGTGATGSRGTNSRSPRRNIR